MKVCSRISLTSLALSLGLSLSACQTQPTRSIPPENYLRWSPTYWQERMNPYGRERAQRQIEIMQMQRW